MNIISIETTAHIFGVILLLIRLMNLTATFEVWREAPGKTKERVARLVGWMTQQFSVGALGVLLMTYDSMATENAIKLFVAWCCLFTSREFILVLNGIKEGWDDGEAKEKAKRK